MPLKVIPPRKGKTPFYYVRGTYLGVALDRSTGVTSREDANRFLTAWRKDIECGALARPGEKTFYDAVVAYMAQVDDHRFLRPLLEYIGRKPLRTISQDFIDTVAISLYPRATAATRNRQVYTPISAVLRLAGVDLKLRRPKGSRGKTLFRWLVPLELFALLEHAVRVDPEFGLFLRFLAYVGPRLGEALALRVSDVQLDDRTVFFRTTKNGMPRTGHLTPELVYALRSHLRGRNDPAGKLFRFSKCGRLYALLKSVTAVAGPTFADVTFHTLRHTWATWMRRYAGLDTLGLIATGAWRDAASAGRYTHTVASEESRRADLLPVEETWNEIEFPANPLRSKHA